MTHVKLVPIIYRYILHFSFIIQSSNHNKHLHTNFMINVTNLVFSLTCFSMMLFVILYTRRRINVEMGGIYLSCHLPLLPIYLTHFLQLLLISLADISYSRTYTRVKYIFCLLMSRHVSAQIIVVCKPHNRLKFFIRTLGVMFSTSRTIRYWSSRLRFQHCLAL